MGEFWDSLWGVKTEHHDNGSRTERWDSGGSYTYDSDGQLTESSRTENSGLFGIGGRDVQVARDPDGRIINIQEKK